MHATCFHKFFQVVQLNCFWTTLQPTDGVYTACCGHFDIFYSDHDGIWKCFDDNSEQFDQLCTYEPNDVCTTQSIRAVGYTDHHNMEVVVDSGTDGSVLPLAYGEVSYSDESVGVFFPAHIFDHRKSRSLDWAAGLFNTGQSPDALTVFRAGQSPARRRLGVTGGCWGVWKGRPHPRRVKSKHHLGGAEDHPRWSRPRRAA